MLKKLICIIGIIAMIFAGTALAEPVAKIHYVFLDWSGEYTGQADTNSIPFGFGIFVSEMPMEGELWHYVGNWEDGLPEGEGTIYFENGSIKKGTFSKGILTEGFVFSATGMAATPITIERTITEDEPAYIGNKKSLRFHYPTCKSVKQMSEKNKVEFSSREEAIALHYIPCGDCNP